jgi:hypothetical protein
LATTVAILPPSLVEAFGLINKYTLNYDLVSDIYDSTLTVDQTIQELKNPLTHCFITTNQDNWVFVNQIEIYYRDQKIDNAAIFSDLDPYPNTPTVEIKRVSEEGGESSWIELHIFFKKFDIVVTDGSMNSENDFEFEYFLGVSAPSHLFRNTCFLIFFCQLIKQQQQNLHEHHLKNVAKKQVV